MTSDTRVPGGVFNVSVFEAKDTLGSLCSLSPWKGWGVSVLTTSLRKQLHLTEVPVLCDTGGLSRPAQAHQCCLQESMPSCAGERAFSVCL